MPGIVRVSKEINHFFKEFIKTLERQYTIKSRIEWFCL